jgi:hypothetical protein
MSTWPTSPLIRSSDKSLAKYDRWAKGFFKTQDFIEMLYKDLKR